MKSKPRIAVVLLNYNSEVDLFECVDQVKKQRGIDLTTIIVDNASKNESVEKIQKWVDGYSPHAIFGKTENVFDVLKKGNKLYRPSETIIIYNSDNKGYSAGNNIGIKAADLLDVDAVLIANPDMRFYDENYLYRLTNVLFSNSNYFVAASKIVDLEGKDQNPIREANFLEELLWPRLLFPNIFKKTSYVLAYETDKIISVPKIMGCCLLLRMDFLREIKYFDENTFLYSEEPILSSQIREKKGEIVFTPFIEAVHAHHASEKGNNSKRMLLFIKSRKYYLKRYSGYNQLQLLLLNFSYAVLAMFHKIKSKVKK